MSNDEIFKPVFEEIFGKRPVSNVSKIGDARKKKEAEVQVYECGTEDCGRQDWRMHDDWALVCNGCDTPSFGTWYVPDVRTGEAKHRNVRKKMLRTINKEGYVCGYCSNMTFHMQADGRLTCFRCKKECLPQFYFPSLGTG